MPALNSRTSHNYHSIVIGGGFYGCSVAEMLSQLGQKVLLVEQEDDLMQRASYVNQARIHQGYHYPRSILTSLRSRINFPDFTRDYADCVHDEFHKFYAIAKIASKVTATQFRLFCERIGAPCRSAPARVSRLFNSDLVEQVFEVTEYAFDAEKLKHIMWHRLQQQGVDVLLQARAEKIQKKKSGLTVHINNRHEEAWYCAERVFNCSYSQINALLTRSGVAPVALKHELTEMALIEMPDILRQFSVTVMDGPFFSVMPFPSKGLHSLSHVRYTPHHHWHDDGNQLHASVFDELRKHKPNSHFRHMLMDARRYIPMLQECRYVESLWETKTVLPQSETDDSRPILFKQCEQIPGLVSIMGGKIDNIYDIRERLSEHIYQTSATYQ